MTKHIRNSNWAIERAAQVWCQEGTKHIEMDVRLADAFARILDDTAAPELLEGIAVALNEVHHPGACAYERGIDIADFLKALIAKAEGRS